MLPPGRKGSISSFAETRCVDLLASDEEYLSTPDGSFWYRMSILSDLLIVVLILIIALLAIIVIVHLLPVLLLVALVLLVVWLVFFRNRRRPVAY